MCLIIVAPEGADNLPETHLTQGMANNPDGWGYAFPHNGKLVIRRGIYRETFWNDWDANRKRMADAPILFHARWATHGGMGVSNCHPFRLDQERHGQLCMAHNGILPIESDADRSDTRVLVEDVLNPLRAGFLDDADSVALLRAFIRGDKLAFLNGEGEFTIIGEERGDWDNGNWYSNGGYLPPAPAPKPYDLKKLLEKSSFTTCPEGAAH